MQTSLPYSLLSYIKGKTTVSPELQRQLEKAFRPRAFKAGEQIVRCGQFNQHRYFVQKGLAKAYLIDPEGEAHVLGFHLENTMMYQTESYYGKTRSEVIIEAVEDMELWAISRQDEEELLSHPDYLRFAYRQQTDELVEYRTVCRKALYQDGQGRYAMLMDTFPEILRRVRLKDIASFVGVTPERLSRIRAQFDNVT
ncbi:hypothetical protein FUAX_02270 [Fulvitalea axinellae]|uniref:Cyclic nucleotide-binding domain-containing protein n=1 Tax=Fulvitalea axinellae TaxID=1182444 RepID=A0AAU9DA98_9BACT|nr:hypothetical protein FUAX_02270 [Fulvitalea axinellae]